MDMAMTYVTLEGQPLRVDYHPHRVRHAGRNIPGMVVNDRSIESATISAEDGAVVETLESATLAPETIEAHQF